MDLKALRTAIRTTPIVDNHAHPLLQISHQDKHPLLSIATEAQGDALDDAWSSLAHIRAVNQLAKLLDCEPTWAAVESAMKAKRTSSGDWTAWVRRCMQGVETILVDDGLDDGDETHHYSWHDQFVAGKCKRIVRIETLATDVMRHRIASMEGEDCSIIRGAILRDFEDEILRFLADPEVVGFKSIICYRGGLDIPGGDQIQVEEAEDELFEIIDSGDFTRLEHKALNHVFVHATARLIAAMGFQHRKPIQFHTGLGDNDIILTKSSPSHLQTFIAEYPDVPIVILHASYPWTREAGYLAAMYPNVYADFGEVFPFISRQGQESVLRQILELCPWSKILWSTDGHWFPETYVLATMQMREVLETTLCDLVVKGDLNERQAIKLVQDILFNNSKMLYDLQTETTLPNPESIPPALAGPQSFEHGSTLSNRDDVIKTLRETGARWLRMVWVDYTGSTRCRVRPVKQVLKALAKSGRGDDGSWTITKAALGLLQNDASIPHVTATGMYTCHVDWSSLKAGPAPGHVSCAIEFREPDGAETRLCPRTWLRHVVERARDDQGLTFLLGFEIEFVVLERRDPSSNNCPGGGDSGGGGGDGGAKEEEKYQILRNDGHAWSMARALADTGRPGSFNSIVDEITDALDAAGIEIEQFHAESAPGQYEVVLPAAPPLEACDALVHARQILESVAARHGFRVTLHPKPFPQRVGTAAHMHISIASSPSSPSPSSLSMFVSGDGEEEDDDDGHGDDPRVYEPFYAGILRHFPAVLAFTYSNPASYERMVDSAWAGGRWITWGRENKEAPLRQCSSSSTNNSSSSHWEFKTLDGLANPYLAAAAILSAGTLGVRDGEPLVWRDCAADPAALSAEQRWDLGITDAFPADLGRALAALQADAALVAHMGAAASVQRYVDVKTAEMGMLSQMDEGERRQWIMERY